MSNEKIMLRAVEVEVGDAIVEEDDYMFGVVEVTREPDRVVLVLANDYSPVREWRTDSDDGGYEVYTHPDNKIPVVRGAGSLVVPSLQRDDPGTN